MFRADIVVSHGPGFLSGVFQHDPGPVGGGHIPKHQHPGHAGNFVFQAMPKFQQIYPRLHQGLAGNAYPVLQQGDDHMFRQELIRVKMPRHILGVYGQYAMGPLG
jgi:hypothetical protein